jgi:hypothetical protein
MTATLKSKKNRRGKDDVVRAGWGGGWEGGPRKTTVIKINQTCGPLSVLHIFRLCPEKSTQIQVTFQSLIFGIVFFEVSVPS